jgi:hypothetical protein
VKTAKAAYYRDNSETIKNKMSVYRKTDIYLVWARKYVHERLRSDPVFRLTRNIRRRVLKVLAGISKSAHTLELLGCIPEELWTHLESKFKPGMTWENYGFKGWHVDHIRPCASFDLTDPEQQRQCFHYTNLQPLWAKENLSKGPR